MWDQDKVRTLVDEWISSGLIEKEFGFDDLRVVKSTDKVVVADNGTNCLLFDVGESTNEALGLLTTALSIRKNVTWIAGSFSEEHRKAIAWLEDHGNVWINTGRYDPLLEELPHMEEHS